MGSDADTSSAGGAGKPKPARPKPPAQDKLLMEKLRLARDGSPGTATILALGLDSHPRTATIRVQPDSGAMFETTIQLLKGHLEVGQSVRVRFNPAHHSKVVLLNATAGGLWHVAEHCPDCGAPVDVAVASVTAHPVCDYCKHPIPRDPA